MENLTNYEKEDRPWGNFERYTLNEQTTVKIITLNANEQISLQKHEHRDEFWRVINGSGTLTVGNDESDSREGSTVFVPRGISHRIASGSDGLTFLEISFGTFDENDETRLDDAYGRVN